MICPQQHADPNGDYVAAVVGSALGLNCQLGYVTNGPDATCRAGYAGPLGATSSAGATCGRAENQTPA